MWKRVCDAFNLCLNCYLQHWKRAVIYYCYCWKWKLVWPPSWGFDLELLADSLLWFFFIVKSSLQNYSLVSFEQYKYQVTEYLRSRSANSRWVLLQSLVWRKLDLPRCLANLQTWTPLWAEFSPWDRPYLPSLLRMTWSNSFTRHLVEATSYQLQLLARICQCKLELHS